MPQVIETLRMRRRRLGSRDRSGTVRFIQAVLGIFSILLLAVILGIAFLQIQISADFPPVTDLETRFGQVGSEAYQPVRFFDRNGDTLLYEAYHAAARDARWLYIKEDGLIDIQEHTLRAIIAAVDPDFFARPVPTLFSMARDFFSTWMQGEAYSASSSIPQALAAAQLLPLGARDYPPNAEQARLMLLGQEIGRTYSKFQVLEWFINSADFGNDIYGLDAAALVYLGKHASELSLAESALLAPIILQPSINPFTAYEESKERQVRVLGTMVEQGWISKGQERDAVGESAGIRLENDVGRARLDVILGRWLKDRLGDQALNRSGLVVYTTIDEELQQQAECLMATQLKRLEGGMGNETVPSSNGGACLAASLLPPLRPRDQGLDHAIEGGAFVILDPRSGEILALAGHVDTDIGADQVISPLIYLTAFSQGYSPGSMILDLPLESTDPGVGAAGDVTYDDAHGPVRIRTALANMYAYAVEQLTNRVGLESVLRISQNLGFALSPSQIDGAESLDRWRVSLFDLVDAYGVLAYQGQKVGAKLATDSLNRNGVNLQPELLYEVEDGNRRLVYRYQPEINAVVSPQLAFLLNDILRDEPARWPRYGAGNPLEVGRPTAAFAGMSADGSVAWTIGYTPSIVIGVWVGNLSDTRPEQLTVTNSAASVWHAMMRYVTRELPATDWTIPPGVSSIEVCDPSGLLPTIYCPAIVNEVYSAGTEPITLDNLYQPYRVNSETGKLATLFTPIDQVEERVYLVPPPEALAWAEAVGLEQPPREYDTLTGELPVVPGVAIQTPKAFDFVRGEVAIRGQASIEEFSNYQLRYGEGLNPARWVQIPEEVRSPVASGLLGRWDTTELNGLYTLQLIVVDEDGQLFSSAVNVTVDNQVPDVSMVLPLEGEAVKRSSDVGLVLQVSVEDLYGVAGVAFYIDGELIGSIVTPPYSMRWRNASTGEHHFSVLVTDLAGNVVSSPVVNFIVE